MNDGGAHTQSFKHAKSIRKTFFVNPTSERARYLP